MDIEKVNEMFLDGLRIKNIAQEVGVSESTLQNFISKQRKLEPTKWPPRKLSINKQDGNSYIQHFHVYECPDCILAFAVEQAYENQSDVCCPVCWTGEVEDVSSGAMKIIRKERVV